MATVANGIRHQGSRYTRAVHALAQLYPRGVRLFWAAPAALALVIVPEFIQHVIEIRLGMFESREAFAALAANPQRMLFGYFKIAGLALAFLATARFWWAAEHNARWWDVRQIVWGRFLFGIVIFFGLGSAPALLAGSVSDLAYQLIGIGWTLLLLPSLFLLLAGLFGDRATPLRAIGMHAWPWLLLTVLLLVLAFAPAQWLHGMNHRWSLGADALVVWTLMLFDALLVGLLAGLTGTALFLGYAAFVGSPARDR